MPISRFSAFLILAVTLSCAGIVSNMTGQTEQVHLPKSISDCDACHNCSKPDADNPCLRNCPRPYQVEGEPIPAERTPDSVVLGELSNLYVPVTFPHKLHATMSAIESGCTLCHHYTPTDKSHPPCRECHEPGPAEGNLRQPGLKGAYHRQCLLCHREWSHDTNCDACHVKKAGGPLAPTVKDQSDIVGVPHPVVREPDTKVYQTDNKEGPVVTFHHEEHVQRFDLKCVDCHQKENCDRCHDVGKDNVSRKSLEEHHQPCYKCHEGEKCGYCHDTREKPLFTHESVGWPHNRFHKALNCRACHPSGKKIARLNTTCTSCHMNWYPGSFKHQVTGLRLGEVHLELDCEDCHLERRFDEVPTCDNCHEGKPSYSGNSLP